ncbi:glucoside xylosyltransferase 1-like isoform X2 [Engraulis encrasicolus]|uniref:glucoside xylosyltransferase 1-like isoform X2 n=1 Tax=Engraulis encrasicolus TaxID=184585 RepID=UPI002FD6E200
MRRRFRLLLFCTLLAFFSVLYVFSQLASSLETDGGFSEQRASRASSRSDYSGHKVKKVSGNEGPADQGWDESSKHSAARQRQQGSAPGEEAGTAGVSEPMHLAVVACGSRLEETLIMLKSALLFSRRKLRFHIFAEDELHSGFTEALNSWPAVYQAKFNYSMYPITFPHENAKEWKKLFKPCASQRLFLPLLLKDVDSLLYVDTDILFLQPVEEIWSFLSHFNSSQMAGMAPEHEEPRIGWYNRFARHPYYGETGVNSGVMLMNMTRIRAKHFKNDMTSVALLWGELLMPLLQKYKLNITWGDQDLLNIIFHHNPEGLFVFPCQWNYRPDHCIYGSNCAAAEQHGVFVLHGNRGVYHNDKQPAFRAIYEAIQQYPFGADPFGALLLPLEDKLRDASHTYCGRVAHLFTKRLRQSVIDLQQRANGPRRSS